MLFLPDDGFQPDLQLGEEFLVRLKYSFLFFIGQKYCWSYLIFVSSMGGRGAKLTRCKLRIEQVLAQFGHVSSSL